MPRAAIMLVTIIVAALRITVVQLIAPFRRVGRAHRTPHSRYQHPP